MTGMQKPLLSLLFLGILLAASGASAASYSYSSVNTSVSGGSSASAQVHTVMSGTGAKSEVWIDGKLMESDQTPPSTPPRESNRQIIDRIRTGATAPVQNNTQNIISVEHKVQNSNGSATGTVHIYSKVNGQVVEDRTLPIPHNNSGTLFFFRASTTVATDLPKNLVRALMASGSHAIIIRDLASSSRLPWLMHTPFFSLLAMDSTSTDSIFGTTQEPFVSLLNRVFNMFR